MSGFMPNNGFFIVIEKKCFLSVEKALSMQRKLKTNVDEKIIQVALNAVLQVPGKTLAQ